MAFAKFQKTATDQAGNILVGANVTVKVQGSTGVATIYSDRDGATYKSNPFQTGSNGEIEFFADGAAYEIIVTTTDEAYSTTWNYVGVGTTAEYDIDDISVGYWTQSGSNIYYNVGNVGIGTSSPLTRLSIDGGGVLATADGDYYGGGAYYNAGWKNSISSQGGWVLRNSSGLFTVLTAPANGAAGSTLSMSERMRIDGSGNVGIGTSSPGKTLDVQGQLRIAGAAASGYALLEYGTSATATNNWHAGSEGDGSFRWYNGVLGAGSEKMRITSAGNVGIGTSSPSEKLSVVGKVLASTNETDATAKQGFFGVKHYTNAEEPFLGVHHYSAVSANTLYLGGGSSSGNAATDVRFYTAANTTTVNGTERMRIDSAGNVGIGTSSPRARLHVDYSTTDNTFNTLISSFRPNLVLEDRSSGATDYQIFVDSNTLQFRYGDASTNATLSSEAMRINNTGKIGIGTSSPSYQLQLSTDSAAKPSTNTWTIASDARIKNVTGEYTKGLDAVCALRPITYKYNGKCGFEDTETENISIIAQEAVNHFPECVGSFKGELDGEETDLLNWNGHALTFALVNAVKELTAKIETLEARVTELEKN